MRKQFLAYPTIFAPRLPIFRKPMYNKIMSDEYEEGINEYKNGHDFYKNSKADMIWNVETPGQTIFNFWTDYPDKLTPEQIEIFKKENPTMAALK